MAQSKSDRTQGVLAFCGHCAPFCGHDFAATEGAPVDVHGPKCESAAGFWEDVVDENGREVGLSGTLVRPYFHGEYDAEAYRVAYRHAELGYVCVTVADRGPAGECLFRELYLSAARARLIAAGLVYLAGQLERPSVPLNGALDRRRAER